MNRVMLWMHSLDRTSWMLFFIKSIRVEAAGCCVWLEAFSKAPIHTTSLPSRTSGLLNVRFPLGKTTATGDSGSPCRICAKSCSAESTMVGRPCVAPHALTSVGADMAANAETVG